MKLPHLVLAALFAVSLPGRACINETGTNLRGEHVDLIYLAGTNLTPHLITPTSKTELVIRSQQVVADVRKSPSFENLIDLTAVLIRHGRLDEAVNLLQFLERKYPGHYETASNIGTAFELMGRNQDALKWIAEGIKRNPECRAATTRATTRWE